MNDNWKTPSYIWNLVELSMRDPVFDPCPLHPDFDGLNTDWKTCSYINPPYSRGQLEKWVPKGFSEFTKLTENCLEPCFIWLVNYGNCLNRKLLKNTASAICDLYQRIAFIDPSTGKPQSGNDRDQVVYLWCLNQDTIEFFIDNFSDIGKVFVCAEDIRDLIKKST